MQQSLSHHAKHFWLLLVSLSCVILFIIGITLSEIRSPAQFTPYVIVPIENGSSLSLVAEELSADHIIRSPFLFRIVVNILHDKNHIGAGDYVFIKPENLWSVAVRLVNSEQDLPSVKVTLPEGLATIQMAPILDMALSSTSTTTSGEVFSGISQFDPGQFMSLASTSEGYLFPDTYQFLPNVTAAEVISTLKSNFDKKILSIQPQISAFIATSSLQKYSINQNDIVIMASILEKEATSTTDRRLIAGILWKRLENDQLLEADPTLVYANLLAGQNITKADILTSKELSTTSPYNTYKYKGLPPTPIDNPGLEALTDAVTPIPSNYWYYLSDSKGVTHYSTTYAEQLVNQQKYLGN